jgi:hypothetical protein
MRYLQIIIVACAMIYPASAQEIPHEFGDVTKVNLNENFDFLLGEIKNLKQELARVRERQVISLPIGTIISWDPIIREANGRPTGDARPVPQGWSICNGTKGTPSLSDTFLMGSDSVVRAGQKGGANSVNKVFKTGKGNETMRQARTDNSKKEFSVIHTHSVSIEFDNRPSFYTVVYLCKIQ